MELGDGWWEKLLLMMARGCRGVSVNILDDTVPGWYDVGLEDIMMMIGTGAL